MIAHWPRGIKATNTWRARPSHVIDIVPTVLELAGAKWPLTQEDQPEMSAALRGQSFLSSLISDKEEPRVRAALVAP